MVAMLLKSKWMSILPGVHRNECLFLEVYLSSAKPRMSVGCVLVESKIALGLYGVRRIRFLTLSGLQTLLLSYFSPKCLPWEQKRTLSYRLGDLCEVVTLEHRDTLRTRDEKSDERDEGCQEKHSVDNASARRKYYLSSF